MSRVQLALRVADLEGSIAFYSRLFDSTPAKRRPGYANFAITEPPLKLVLLEGKPGEETHMDHLGVEVENTDLVTNTTNRLASAGLTTRVEGNTTCCYAVQDKVWSPVPAASRGRSTPSPATTEPTSKVKATSPCQQSAETAPAAPPKTPDEPKPAAELGRLQGNRQNHSDPLGG